MKDFDLRKYLAENKLLKEEVSQFLIDSFIEGVKDAFGEESNLYATEGDEYEKLKTAAEEVISSTDSGDTTVEELIYASQLYALGLAENKLLEQLSPEEKAMEIEKAKVEKTIEAFDDENYDYRYKFYDVDDHEGEIFVVYNTQSDFEQIRGKEMLRDLLSNFPYPIYVHYTVRDNYSPKNHDLYTKKGFELA